MAARVNVARVNAARPEAGGEVTVEARSWPGDHRTMLRVTAHLWVDARPVTHADYARFVVATGHTSPPGWTGVVPPSLRDDHPVVHVDLEDGRAYARWAGKRLPLQREWSLCVKVCGPGATDVGRVWEWTASRHKDGHVVRGGPYRNRSSNEIGESEPGLPTNRSWEDSGARDLGFRCVAED